jgi:hypothetical protein
MNLISQGVMNGPDHAIRMLIWMVGFGIVTSRIVR